MRIPHFLVFVSLFLLVALAACSSSKPKHVPPEARFGHRYEGEGPNGHETMVVTPPDSSTAYYHYPVFVDTLHVRPAPFAAGVPTDEQKVPVEVLAEGSLINSCWELDDLEQERAGNIITIDLIARQPKGAVCVKVQRPFRFYIQLPGRYGPGSYSLDINDIDYAFTISGSS